MGLARGHEALEFRPGTPTVTVTVTAPEMGAPEYLMHRHPLPQKDMRGCTHPATPPGVRGGCLGYRVPQQPLAHCWVHPHAPRSPRNFRCGGALGHTWRAPRHVCQGGLTDDPVAPRGGGGDSSPVSTGACCFGTCAIVFQPPPPPTLTLVVPEPQRRTLPSNLQPQNSWAQVQQEDVELTLCVGALVWNGDWSQGHKGPGGAEGSV